MSLQKPAELQSAQAQKFQMRVTFSTVQTGMFLIIDA